MVKVAVVDLQIASEMKSLGVVLDSRLTFENHLQAMCRACNYDLWALRHIQHLLSKDVAQTLACSIVIISSHFLFHISTIDLILCFSHVIVF